MTATKILVLGAFASLSVAACANADPNESQGGRAALEEGAKSVEPQRVAADVKFPEPTSLSGASCTTLETVRRGRDDVLFTFTFGKPWKFGSVTSKEIVHAKLESHTASGRLVETNNEVLMQRTVTFVDERGGSFNTADNSYEFSERSLDGDKFVTGIITIAEAEGRTILVYQDRADRKRGEEHIVVPVRCEFVPSEN